MLEIKDLCIVEKLHKIRISWTKEGGYCSIRKTIDDKVLEKLVLVKANQVRVSISKVHIIEVN